MKKPKLAFITHHNCARVTKEAWVLKNLGYEIRLISHLPKEYDKSLYDSINYYETPEKFRSTIKLFFGKVDIFHVHNTPDWMAWTIRELNPKAKIILDVHDSNRWLFGEQTVDATGEKVIWYDEDMAIGCSNGLVLPSLGCQKEIKTRTSKPTTFIPPACPEDWYITKPQGFYGGAVINGGVSMDVINSGEIWRNYTDLCKALRGKCQIYMYTPSITARADDKLNIHYMNLGCRISKMMMSLVIEKLGEHSWNIVGNWLANNKKIKVFDINMPNKFFDAVAAGIPSVSFGVQEVNRLIEKYDIGIVANTPDEFIERWDEHIQKRTNLAMHRRKLSMENFIGNLTKFYDNF